jgi:tRNA pseudouridine55 synthase
LDGVGPGLYLVHKPVGPTSFSVVREWAERARVGGGRALKVCHGGTLDPFAEGLLLILVGQATKLFEYLHGVPKVYEATVHWGVETDNGDPLGRVISTGDATGLSPARLEEALREFVGWRGQTPPATSAKRVGGERAYVRAHRGERVELPPARVYLHEARWLGHELETEPRRSRLRVVVRGGLYVRALARDLGRRLGCGAHLSELRRTDIGPWSDPAGPGRAVEVSGRGLLPWLASRELSDQEVGELRRERAIPAGDVIGPDWPLPAGFPGDPDPPVRGFHRGRLVFLLRRGESGFRAVVALHGGI